MKVGRKVTGLHNSRWLDYCKFHHKTYHSKGFLMKREIGLFNAIAKYIAISMIVSSTLMANTSDTDMQSTIFTDTIDSRNTNSLLHCPIEFNINIQNRFSNHNKGQS